MNGFNLQKFARGMVALVAVPLVTFWATFSTTRVVVGLAGAEWGATMQSAVLGLALVLAASSYLVSKGAGQ